MSYNSKTYEKTICWDCRNATGKCSWSKDFTPVAGWVAEPTVIRSNYGTGIQSYIVKRCPLFKEG